MTESEIKLWFLGILDNCYPVRCKLYPDDIFWFYSERYIRNIKLYKINKLLNRFIPISDDVKGVCILDYEIFNNRIYINNTEVWLKFKEVYGYDCSYSLIGEVIKLLIGDRFGSNIYYCESLSDWFSESLYENMDGLSIDYNII